MTTSTTGQPLIRVYGCCHCQRVGKPYWHRKGLDAKYEEHLIWQSKHGTYERTATPNEVLALIRMEGGRAAGP